MAIALALLRSNCSTRNLYLYDTFAGMTEPTDADVDFTGSVQRRGAHGPSRQSAFSDSTPTGMSRHATNWFTSSPGYRREGSSSSTTMVRTAARGRRLTSTVPRAGSPVLLHRMDFSGRMWVKQ
jgi:hypothetical protein